MKYCTKRNYVAIITVGEKFKFWMNIHHISNREYTHAPYNMGVNK